MNSLRSWLERLKHRPASGNEGQDQRHHEMREALANCSGADDWLTLSTDRNGFVREVAVRALSDQPSSAALVALLERANDWVPQVRELAVAGVWQYLRPEQSTALLQALPAWLALARRQRTDHGPMLVAVRSVLQTVEVRAEVEATFLKQRGQVARFLFALLQEASESSAAFLAKALAHSEITIRQLAVEACQALPAEQSVPLLLRALNLPGASVRVKALHGLLALLSDSRELLRDALLEASPTIRSLALWAAPRWRVDAREVLNTRLKGNLPTLKREWLGVLGLARELGVDLDTTWQTMAWRSPCSSVRLAIVEGLADEQLSDLLRALDDSSDKVFAKALERLRGQAWMEIAPDLDARLDRDWHLLSPARRQALMQVRPRWQQLAYLLRRLDACSDERNAWLALIGDWCRAQYAITDPVTSRSERERLVDRIRYLELCGDLPSGSATRLT